ncbi:hypothetical protein B0T11DRAFT_324292 [Plectosphaerella cucumerina]|uniref:Uncharacterized protein n=1 Tax=Plectosphaerella cucumerina TaxID=40658 RepID=A0A8K0TQ32_9PEZI|nr:hypothetical protein B0T11DRAFT_324292 [Plectosphaerella cucumerina]
MSRPKIEDAEFDDWLQLDEQDTNWVSQQAAHGLPLVLPWKKQTVRLGACFRSERLMDDPWLTKENPFILSDLYTTPKVLRTEVGSTSTFHSVATSRKTETGKHLALGFGIGVGLPFLCSASVKGTYDEHLRDNNDSDKSSIRASLRCGVVELEHNPRLCHEALAMLKYGGGYKAFTDKYGDYFLWGYRLGGDTGLMLSSSAFEKEVVEQYSIKAALKVLFIEVSHTWAKNFHTFSASKRMRLLGYDTLSDTNWNVTQESPLDMQNLSSQAKEVILRSQNLLERSMKLLENQGMHDGDHLSNSQCDFLTNVGMVVELVLLPMSSLRDVARWTTERNVI